LACLLARPVRIRNIRAKRKPPGLKPQHLLSALAAGEISGGDLSGARLGSTEVLFTPGPVRPGGYSFDVCSIKSSAGSTTLIFQTLLPAFSFARKTTRLTIKGGTHVPWSPSADYIQKVFLPTAAAMGINADVDVPVLGYYPVGGGELYSVIKPARLPLKPLELPERSRLKKIQITSTLSNLPVHIAKRQLERVVKRVRELQPPEAGLHTECIEAPAGAGGVAGRGTSVFILAEFEKGRAGFTSLGARGKPAEKVADEAADGLESFLKKEGALDPHLADQLILYMALAAGISTVSVSSITTHLKTNIHVVEKFLPVSFDVTGVESAPGMVCVEGAAHKGG
jgi:RNA 3'-terminal phosphate cyclase (ATP)